MQGLPVYSTQVGHRYYKKFFDYYYTTKNLNLLIERVVKMQLGMLGQKPSLLSHLLPYYVFVEPDSKLFFSSNLMVNPLDLHLWSVFDYIFCNCLEKKFFVVQMLDFLSYRPKSFLINLCSSQTIRFLKKLWIIFSELYLIRLYVLTSFVRDILANLKLHQALCKIEKKNIILISRKNTYQYLFL